jgi:hypothetical protein
MRGLENVILRSEDIERKKGAEPGWRMLRPTGRRRKDYSAGNTR